MAFLGGLPRVNRPAYDPADTPPTSTNQKKSFLLRSGVRVSCEPTPDRASLRTSRSASRFTSREHIAVADRYFTPTEANELLPTVRPLVEGMVAHRRALALPPPRPPPIAAKNARNGGGGRPPQVDELQA